MKTILGLDLGVGSVGWALISTDEDYIPMEILGTSTGLSPFRKGEGNDFATGKGITVCSKRTKDRSIRNGYDRKKRRRRHLTERLSSLGMIDPENRMFTLSSMKLWQMRADAATEGKRLTLPQIGRVLLHMEKKRGYKHTKEDSGESKKSKYVANISKNYCNLHNEGLTVGQYFAKRLKASEYITATGKAVYSYRIKKQDAPFPRKAYEEEFDQIMKVQSVFYPEILTFGTIAELKHIIFYQRPLKSCKHLVSHCEFMRYLFQDKHRNGKLTESGPRVAHKSSPLSQVCNIYETINNIRLVNPFNRHNNISVSQESFSGGKLPKDLRLMQYEYTLDNDERACLFNELCKNERINGDKILQKLNLTATGFKFKQSEEKSFKGFTTLIKLRKALRGIPGADELLQFELRQKDLLRTERNSETGETVLKPVIDEETGEVMKVIDDKFINEPLFRLWHLVYSISDKDELAKAIAHIYGEKYPEMTSPEVIDRLFAIDFKKEGYTNRSCKFMRMLLPSLIKGEVYSKAAERAGINHSGSITKEENQNRKLLPRLKHLLKGSLRQPTVEKILNHMIGVVNAIIDRYGRPDEIHVELARELRQSKENRVRTTQKMAQNENVNKIIREQLIEHGLRATRSNIQKWKLLRETNNHCIYCDEPVDRPGFFGSNEVEKEHIIPRSRFFDDSFSNKVCSCHKCNHDKGNQTGYDFKAAQGEEKLNRYITRVESLYANEKISWTKRVRLLTAGTDIPKDFLNRDLGLTQYITRKALEILKDICYEVSPTTGRVTDFFRHIWGYDEILHSINFKRYENVGLIEEVECIHNGLTHLKRRIKDWSKRLDHRHHAIDALVVALTRSGYVQRLSNLNKEHEIMFQETGSKKNWQKKHLVEEWGVTRPHFPVYEVAEAVSCIAVTSKAKMRVTTSGKDKDSNKDNADSNKKASLIPRGALHNETIYGKIKVIDHDASVKYAFENPDMVIIPEIRDEILKRLEIAGKDVEKALKETKKNPLKKGSQILKTVPCYVLKAVTRYEIKTRKYEHLKDIVDNAAREAIRARYDEPEIAHDHIKFQQSLNERPIMVGGKDKHPIKHIRCFVAEDSNSLVPVRKDADGNTIGYAAPENNHHVAFYKDSKGDIHTHVATFYDCVIRHKYSMGAIITNPAETWIKVESLPDSDELTYMIMRLPKQDWTFLSSLCKNEMFVLGLSQEEFLNAKVSNDLKTITSHLYQLESLSHNDYVFRLHSAAGQNKSIDKSVKNKIRIPSYKALQAQNPKKVRVTLLGEILFD